MPNSASEIVTAAEPIWATFPARASKSGCRAANRNPPPRRQNQGASSSGLDRTRAFAWMPARAEAALRRYFVCVAPASSLTAETIASVSLAPRGPRSRGATAACPSRSGRDESAGSVCGRLAAGALWLSLSDLGRARRQDRRPYRGSSAPGGVTRPLPVAWLHSAESSHLGETAPTATEQQLAVFPV
jgi:hypothetical protein